MRVVWIIYVKSARWKHCQRLELDCGWLYYRRVNLRTGTKGTQIYVQKVDGYVICARPRDYENMVQNVTTCSVFCMLMDTLEPKNYGNKDLFFSGSPFCDS